MQAFFKLLLPFWALAVGSWNLSAQKAISYAEENPIHPIDQQIAERQTQLNGNKNFQSIQELQSALLQVFANPTEQDFPLSYERTTSVSQHFAFERFWKNRRIYRAEIKCNLNLQGELWSWYHLPVVLNEVDPQALTGIQWPSMLAQVLPSTVEAIWFPVSSGLVKAQRYFYKNPAAHLNHELIVSEDGQTAFYFQDLHAYHHLVNPTDTTIQVTVFNPDPLTTAGQVYGGLFTDQNDADIGALNNQRVTVSTRGTFDNGMFYLENDFIKVEDFEMPSSTPPVQNNPNFSFTRAEQGFEYVNVLYHLTLYQYYMQGLGFNLVGQQLSVDPHAFFGQDNSYFSPGTGLGFGEGGVDDAEDADVIIHEYGHAISYSASPGTNSGTERRTLDEALSDYLAASYSHHLNPFNWERVYSWDGHNVFWPGRMVTTNKNYQNVSFFSSIYEHTDLWAGSLMEIYFNEGRPVADRVLLQSLYGQASNMSFEHAALEYLQADTLLFWAQHAMDMYTVFFNRGILNIPDIGHTEQELSGMKVLNSQGFSQGGVLEVVLANPGAELTIYNATGQLCKRMTTEGNRLQLSAESLKSGIYFMYVQCHDGSRELIRLIRH